MYYLRSTLKIRLTCQNSKIELCQRILLVGISSTSKEIYLIHDRPAELVSASNDREPLK